MMLAALEKTRVGLSQSVMASPLAAALCSFLQEELPVEGAWVVCLLLLRGRTKLASSPASRKFRACT